jgi:RNA polymerase sigma-70 factor, ECF subfamily
MTPSAATNPGTATAPPLSTSTQFQRDLIALMPNLRAFARVLCAGRPIAEDMAQEALAKAWCARGRFEPGTNLKAWLFTILRNEVYSHGRRAWREVNWDAEKGERIAAPTDEQDWTMELSDTARALHGLPEGQRDALILVGVGGFSYEDGARIFKVPVGTVKSRAARGRTALANILDGGKPLPRRPTAHMPCASDDILAQLSALAPSGAHRAGVPA